MTGGYFMLDGLGIELTGDPKVYAGSWDAAVEAVGSGKPIIAYNTLYATAPVTPVPVFGWYLSWDISEDLDYFDIEIDDDDTVTIVDVAS